MHESKSQASHRDRGTLDLRRVMIAGHYILVLYGHWAVNDPRGSGSNDLKDFKFAPLGPIHFGRKAHEAQPSREALREFHRQHQDLLNFPVFWINEHIRGEIASAIGEVIHTRGYTCYACAICGNHAHLVIRKHKDAPATIWENFAEGIRHRLRLRFPDKISAKHPVISARPYKVYLSAPDEVCGRIDYVNGNPLKEGLPVQRWEFVEAYNNWPMHKEKRQSS